MEKILTNGDIIELDDKEFYYVIAKIVYNGEEFADVIKFPENPENIFNLEKYSRTTIKIEEDKNELFVYDVENQEIKEKVRKAGELKTKVARRVKRI